MQPTGSAPAACCLRQISARNRPSPKPILNPRHIKPTACHPHCIHIAGALEAFLRASAPEGSLACCQSQTGYITAHQDSDRVLPTIPPRTNKQATIMTPSAHSPRPPSSCPESMTPQIRPLSIWNQTSLRSYMRVMVCFAFDNQARHDAIAHIRLSLARLARQRPDFAGTLEVSNLGAMQGCIFLRTSPDNEIPLEVHDLSAGEFRYGKYEELRKANFPPGDFVDERFSLPCSLNEGEKAVPVSTIKIFFVNGGLLLSIFLHHSFADGECLRMFVESFAAQTRGEPIEFPSDLQWHQQGPASKNSEELKQIVQLIPEYTLLDEPVGPTMPRPLPDGIPTNLIKKTGRTFVFKNEKLDMLRSHLQSRTNGPTLPSNYICLAALTWAHVTQARLRDIEYVPRGDGSSPARLQTMVNWKRRARREACKEYFGNATAIAMTHLSTREVLEACTDLDKLAVLITSVDNSIRGVDDEFVRRRTDFFESLPDPRFVGLDFDPRTPQDLGFNTWRYFGADSQWRIPGIAEPTPDAIRRIQDVWNMSGALILPAKRDSRVHELLVTLPASSMDILCEDEGWMCWVDQVVG